MLKQLLNALGLTVGAMDLALATNTGRGGHFYNYSQPNQRKKRKEMRRTVFANRHIRMK